MNATAASKDPYSSAVLLSKPEVGAARRPSAPKCGGAGSRSASHLRSPPRCAHVGTRGCARPPRCRGAGSAVWRPRPASSARRRRSTRSSSPSRLFTAAQVMHGMSPGAEVSRIRGCVPRASLWSPSTVRRVAANARANQYESRDFSIARLHHGGAWLCTFPALAAHWRATSPISQPGTLCAWRRRRSSGRRRSSARRSARTPPCSTGRAPSSSRTAAGCAGSRSGTRARSRASSCSRRGWSGTPSRSPTRRTTGSCSCSRTPSSATTASPRTATTSTGCPSTLSRTACRCRR